MKRALVVSIVSSALACGVRTPLGVTSDGGAVNGGDASTSCPAWPAPVSCPRWLPSGDPVLVADATDASVGVTITTAIGDGCGAVVGWYSSSGRDGSALAWFTRAIAFDGAPRAAIQAHPALADNGVSGVMELVAKNGRLAALVSDAAGCRFAALGAVGADDGPIVTEMKLGCRSFAVDGDGFSFLVPSSQGVTPVELDHADARGMPTSGVRLDVPKGRSVWNRLVFDDGSFLLGTFSEDPRTAVYTDWLQRFDRKGNALGPETTVGANTAPVLLARTSRGALAAWQWSNVHVVPMDRDGVRTGAEHLFAGGSPLYGATLTTTPTGDVLLTWVDLGSDSHFRLSAQALGPDGAAYDAPVLLRAQLPSDRVFPVVAPSGDRGVVVYADHGIRALPIGCVAH